jgi:high-affinity iron transporter
MLLTRLLIALSTLALLFVVPAASADSPRQDLQQADQSVLQARAALARGDTDAARQSYQSFRDRWVQIEDGVKDASPSDYAAIETAMRAVRVSLTAQPFDATATDKAFDALHDANADFFGVPPAASGQPSPTDDAAARLQALVDTLGEARDAVVRRDASAALAEVKSFEKEWPASEGLVKVKSPAAYAATEDDMANVEAMLSGATPRFADADATLVRMRDRLAPIAEAGASYGIFDAFVIMLREGLEALLVVGALAAFLKRSGNSDKQHWIYGGAGVGVVLSIVLAVVLQQIFARAEVGLGGELVEGIVGLSAAAMLFYVSYWLHSKARLGVWQQYIRQRSSAALAGGSMLSLSVVALLAVFREGAETAVFYLGIAPSIAPRDLLVGLGLGVLALAAIGTAVLVIGVRLPLRPFFLASSVLIYYLGFKFVGTGVHALQIAGVIPATPAPLPGNDVIGIYPTWETALPQLLLLLAACAVLWITIREQRQATASFSTSS